MKNKFIILIVLITAAIIWACTKDFKETRKGALSDAVKTYFAFTKVTDGLDKEINNPNSSVKNAVVGESNKSANDLTDQWPDFYIDPFFQILNDSCNLSETYSTNEDGDFVTYYDFGDEGVSCPDYDYIKKGNATNIYVYGNNLQEPVIFRNTIIADCELSYPSTGKCFGLAGNFTYSASHQKLPGSWVVRDSASIIDTVWIEKDSVWINKDINITMGECNKEINFISSQACYWTNPTSGSSYEIFLVIHDGSSSYTGENATYNTTIIQPVKKRLGTNHIVQGVEEVTYTKNGISGQFTIDYGDGTDDTLVTVTENGASYQIDYIQLQEEMYASME